MIMQCTFYFWERQSQSSSEDYEGPCYTAQSITHKIWFVDATFYALMVSHHIMRLLPTKGILIHQSFQSFFSSGSKATQTKPVLSKRQRNSPSIGIITLSFPCLLIHILFVPSFSHQFSSPTHLILNFSSRPKTDSDQLADHE